MTLVEPLLRRSTFLSEAVAELGLERVEVVRARAEELHGQARVLGGHVPRGRPAGPAAGLVHAAGPSGRCTGRDEGCVRRGRGGSVRARAAAARRRRRRGADLRRRADRSTDDRDSSGSHPSVATRLGHCGTRASRHAAAWTLTATEGTGVTDSGTSQAVPSAPGVVAGLGWPTTRERRPRPTTTRSTGSDGLRHTVTHRIHSPVHRAFPPRTPIPTRTPARTPLPPRFHVKHDRRLFHVKQHPPTHPTRSWWRTPP